MHVSICHTIAAGFLKPALPQYICVASKAYNCCEGSFNFVSDYTAQAIFGPISLKKKKICVRIKEIAQAGIVSYGYCLKIFLRQAGNGRF